MMVAGAWLRRWLREVDVDESKHTPVARVAEVHMSRYTIEWTNGALPEGTDLYAPDLAAEVERLRADLDAERRKAAEQGRNAVELFDGCKRLQAENADLRRKVEALEKDAALAVGRTAARCREMALWPQGIDDEQAFYGRMFAEFIDKEFGAQIRAALAASDPQKGGA